MSSYAKRLTQYKYAVQHNRIETCEFLLKAGADPCIEDDSGMYVSQSKDSAFSIILIS